MQLTQLFPKFDELQRIYGDKNLSSVYGAGQIDHPDVCLIFMNPTSRNVSASTSWTGLKAPWLGTKKVWQLLTKLGLFNNKNLLRQIETMRHEEWTPAFSHDLYKEILKESLYITNIAKCTQIDARHLPDSVFKAYMPLMLQELSFVQPKVIISLGNQVSSVLLSKTVSVSRYSQDEHELLTTEEGISYRVYPTYYPVGQGQRNMPKAIERIRGILTNILIK